MGGQRRDETSCCQSKTWCGGANFDDIYTQLQREYQVVSFFCKGDVSWQNVKNDIVHYH